MAYCIVSFPILNSIFMDDVIFSYTLKSVKNAFEPRDANILKKPAQSSNLNLEKLWETTEVQVGVQCSTNKIVFWLHNTKTLLHQSNIQL